MKNTSIHVNHALIVSGMTQVFNMFCHYYLLLPGTWESVQSTTEAFNRDEQAQPQQRSYVPGSLLGFLLVRRFVYL